MVTLISPCVGAAGLPQHLAHAIIFVLALQAGLQLNRWVPHVGWNRKTTAPGLSARSAMLTGAERSACLGCTADSPAPLKPSAVAKNVVFVNTVIRAKRLRACRMELQTLTEVVQLVQVQGAEVKPKRARL